jgi:GST-like protein
MIDLFFWPTDNGHKGRMGLEECGLPYRIRRINIREGNQFDPEFLSISPGHKIPAILDPNGPGHEPLSLCESGAILKYLAEKSNRSDLYPSDARERAIVDQWLFYGSATFTTLSQQYGHFVIRARVESQQAQLHYTNVFRDMLGVLDRHLHSHEFFADRYTIADMAIFPDVHTHGVRDIGLGEFPHLQRWHDAVFSRSAIQRAWAPLDDLN